jgi:4-hydroxybenzoate polyprenyltransferase
VPVNFSKTAGNYLSLVKFSHTIFAMPFAIIGFVIGVTTLKQKTQSTGIELFHRETLFGLHLTIWSLFVLVILCMVFARSAAMAFNRYIDERYDKLNPRTAVREIPSGIIPKKNALWFVIINCALFIFTTLWINPICFYLSPIALFVILFYSYTKRFTALCHVVLGVGLSLAPIGAYLAVTGVFDWIPLLFSLVVLTWVSGFDILYALQDEDFDRGLNLKSIPVLLGRTGAMHLSNALHLLTAALVIFIGYWMHAGWLYIIGATLFIGLLFYQHYLVKPNDISKVNLAFATTNGIAAVVFAVFVVVEFLFAK